MAKSPLTTLLFGMLALALAGCETAPRSYADRLASRPAPRTEEQRAAECAWVRSEISFHQAAVRIGEQMTMTSGIAAATARSALAALEAYSAGIPCTADEPT